MALLYYDKVVFNGDYLKFWRLDRGMTLVDLAKRLDTDYQQIQRWENTLCTPNLNTAARICSVLQISLYDLLD